MFFLGLWPDALLNISKCLKGPLLWHVIFFPTRMPPSHHKLALIAPTTLYTVAALQWHNLLLKYTISSTVMQQGRHPCTGLLLKVLGWYILTLRVHLCHIQYGFIIQLYNLTLLTTIFQCIFIKAIAPRCEGNSICIASCIICLNIIGHSSGHNQNKLRDSLVRTFSSQWTAELICALQMGVL